MDSTQIDKATQKQLEADILNALHDVKDPEIPTLSVVDLGIIIKVEVDENRIATVTMTPTFSGCPALQIIQQQVKVKTRKVKGIKNSKVEVNFDVHWTTDMITDEGRATLKKFGIAPPKCYAGADVAVEEVEQVDCPYCGSSDTKMYTPFGPTLCRSIHKCNNCLETFEQFKPVS